MLFITRRSKILPVHPRLEISGKETIMPIKIPNELPATQVLQDENIFVMTETRAMTQDIRPLHILMLNLMPLKIATETQIARLLGNTPLQVELELIQTASHKASHTSEEHMLQFYKTFDEIKHERFDGLIITGAPVEQMPFEDVEYWPELCQIMEWSKTHVTSTLHICWGAQAGLYYHFGVPKSNLPKKLFGVYPIHADYKRSILLRGFDDIFYVPCSRHTESQRSEIEKHPEIKVLASSEQTGVYICMTPQGRQVFVMNHPEYDADTLQKEYLRDKNAGLPIDLPFNYFKNDNENEQPLVTWRSCANLLYSNWLNYFVYQSTPYQRKDIK